MPSLTVSFSITEWASPLFLESVPFADAREGELQNNEKADHLPELLPSV
jgi:hypothetical protein